MQHIFALKQYLITMKVDKALENLIKSNVFREKAKEKSKDGGNLRMFLTRYQRGEVKTGAAITMLEKFGYQIEVSNNKLK